MAQYIVKKGDNLSTLAKKNGLKLKDILAVNKIENPDLIQIGQKINLPNKSSNFRGTNYAQFSEDYNSTPKWNKTTYNAGNSTTILTSPNKQAPKSIKKVSIPEKTPGFLDSIKSKLYETYQDITTALDQQTSKKVIAKPKVKIDDSFIDYGYKELGAYKDHSFKAGEKDSLLSAINVFDNDKGFDYIVAPKLKEGKRTFNNVKGVAHFLMDTDITDNQKYTSPYKDNKGQEIKSAVPNKFIPYVGKNPTDYVMYSKKIGYDQDGNEIRNVKYGQVKDKDKYKGYEQIKVRNIPFGDLDFNNKKSAGFAKKASYIGTLDGKQTSIITDPDSNDVYGRFSGGSGTFYFKEPKTGKIISADAIGSVNTIKKIGEELSQKYNVDPKQLQFLYQDMGSYSAKPKSHNGVISNEQWANYNSNNKGYSGGALLYPKEHGGYVFSDHIPIEEYTNPLSTYAEQGAVVADKIYNLKEKPKGITSPNDIADVYNRYNKIVAEHGLNNLEMERDNPVDSITSYNRDVNKFAWKNVAQGYPALQELQKQQQAPQQMDSSYYVTKTPKGYLNVYDKSNKLVGYSMDNKTIVKQEPNFEDGGQIQAWVQKFSTGGTTNPYITPYTNFPQEENPIQGFTNLQAPVNGVPMAQSNVPQNMGTNFQTSFDASNDQVNMDNKQASSMMGGKSPMPTNPADAVLGGVNAVGDVATGALTAFAKPGSKGAAYAEGSQRAQAVTKPLEKIPILGQASKLIAGIIGGALNARKQGIEDEETAKNDLNLQYATRNLINTNQPSYYGQSMAKYGANPKMMEQRVIDDIYTDFDKYMKII